MPHLPAAPTQAQAPRYQRPPPPDGMFASTNLQTCIVITQRPWFTLGFTPVVVHSTGLEHVYPTTVSHRIVSLP